MLLFIPCNNIRYCYGCIFQYISCYCLSIWDRLTEKDKENFNTSHVTVYLYSLFIAFLYSSFQYISCYCLSLSISGYVPLGLISIHLMLLFICSVYRVVLHNLSISIHLMLLFIISSWNGQTILNVFQYISCYCLSNRQNKRIKTGLISIHLMLLFIGFTQPVIIDKNKFQYISCYCLSKRQCVHFITYLIFQYISCYCLSTNLFVGGLEMTNFNTSHVTVYHSVRAIRKTMLQCKRLVFG